MKNNPFKMKNPMLAKSAKDSSPMQLNYNGVSPVKFDPSKVTRKDALDFMVGAIKKKLDPTGLIEHQYNLYKKDKEAQEAAKKMKLRRKTDPRFKYDVTPYVEPEPYQGAKG